MEVKNAGIHPWTIQGDTESHIVLFNHSKSDKKVGIFINAGSTLWSSETVLAGSETREVSINKLQRDQIPDDQGRLLSLSVKEGTVDWMTPESGDVTGRLMVTSRSRAMARNFSCGTYKSECSLQLSTYFSDITPGSQLQMYEAAAEICINSQPLQCSNTSATNGTVNYNWTVGAVSIITLNASTEQPKPSPMLLGVSGGNGTAAVTASAGACQSSGTENPTVQAPITFPNIQTLNSEQLNSTTVPACGPNQTGWQREVIRQVKDQNNLPIMVAGQQMAENVTIGPGTNGLNLVPATRNATTDAQGQVIDTFNFCSAACPSSSSTTNFTQAITDTWEGIAFDLGTYLITYSCSSIKFNGLLTP
jgi:hypothetical protein